MTRSFLYWTILRQNLRDADNREFCEELVEQCYLGARHFRGEYAQKGVQPIAFSDAELRSVRVPTLLLIGKQEVLYDPEAALSRAKRLMPKLEAELIPRASHDMSFNRYEIVDARVLAFLEPATELAKITEHERRKHEGPGHPVGLPM